MWSALAVGNIMLRKILCAGLVVLAGIVRSTPSDAAVVDFNLPSNVVFFGQYFQDGLEVLPNDCCSGFVNWVAQGSPQFNADDTADIAQTLPNPIMLFYVGSTMVAQAFDLHSIGLASANNDATGGDVKFTFNHKDGSVD